MTAALATASALLFAATLSGGQDSGGPASPPPAEAVSAEDAEANRIVSAALARIGAGQWSKMTSLESIATAATAMGEARIEFRFVAPDARLLVQTMPGGRGVVEMGVVKGIAWMGSPGRARAIDPALAAEMSGGGDLQSLVHELDARFGEFRIEGRQPLDGRDAHRITMAPKRTADTPAMPRWTLWIDAANTTILGLDIPAPPAEIGADAPVAGAQTIRLRDWRPVEVPVGADPGRMLAFGTAVIESGGMRTELTFSRVAIDTLTADSIAPPARIEPSNPTMPAQR